MQSGSISIVQEVMMITKLDWFKGKVIVSDQCPPNTMYMFTTEPKIKDGKVYESIKDVVKATNIGGSNEDADNKN